MTDTCPYTPYAPGTSLRGLRTAELFLVLTARLWVQAAVAPDRAAGDWREGCRHAGIDEDGIAAFDTLFGIVAALARVGLIVPLRPGEIDSPGDAYFAPSPDPSYRLVH